MTPPRRGQGERLIYLDYDAVLHPERVYGHPKRGPYIQDPRGHALFEHELLLEYFLRPYPEVLIVLSTSWSARVPAQDRFRLNTRGGYGYSKAKRFLPHGLQTRCIGATFHSAMDWELFKQAPRGMQVWSDVLRRKPADWLALDDDYLHWPAWCREKLVVTCEEDGIAKPSVRAEIEAKLEILTSSPAACWLS